MKRKSFHLILRDPTVYSLTVRLQHLYPSFMLHPSTRTCKHIVRYVLTTTHTSVDGGGFSSCWCSILRLTPLTTRL